MNSSSVRSISGSDENTDKCYPARHLADDGKAISNRSPPGTGNELRDRLFTATLINGDGLMHWEITDHRVDGCGNNGTWKEQVDCLICGTTIE
jgi:hypothetical protein